MDICYTGFPRISRARPKRAWNRDKTQYNTKSWSYLLLCIQVVPHPDLFLSNHQYHVSRMYVPCWDVFYFKKSSIFFAVWLFLESLDLRCNYLSYPGNVFSHSCVQARAEKGERKFIRWDLLREMKTSYDKDFEIIWDLPSPQNLLPRLTIPRR